MNFADVATSEFLEWNPARAAVVDDVRFRIRVRGEKVRHGRNLLVISTADLGQEEEEKLLAVYKHALGDTTLSFPLRERASILRSRLGENEFIYLRFFFLRFMPKFRGRAFRIPKKKTLETVILLEKLERDRLERYIANVLKNALRTLGGFSYKGTQSARGGLENNRPIKGLHNCTSWMATAPIAQDGKTLMEELGADLQLEVGTTPAWWTNWLLAAAPAKRVPFAILWTPDTLERTLSQISSGQNLEWDFNR